MWYNTVAVLSLCQLSIVECSKSSKDFCTEIHSGLLIILSDMIFLHTNAAQTKRITMTTLKCSWTQQNIAFSRTRCTWLYSDREKNKQKKGFWQNNLFGPWECPNGSRLFSDPLITRSIWSSSQIDQQYDLPIIASAFFVVGEVRWTSQKVYTLQIKNEKHLMFDVIKDIFKSGIEYFL